MLYKFLYFNYKWLKDREEIKLLRKIIKPGMTVVDVGANIGFYSVLLAKLVGKRGSVHAFEPDYTNFRHLMRVCKKYRNIKINRSAIGSKSGKINIFVSDDLNVDHLTYDDGSNRRRVLVPCLSLDKYIGNKTMIDFVKIDTQGFEYQVLLGMKKTIRNSPRIMILAEFSAFDLSMAGINPRDHIDLVKKLGLKTYVLGKKLSSTDEDSLLTKNSNRAVYYNLLYIRADHSINF